MSSPICKKKISFLQNCFCLLAPSGCWGDEWGVCLTSSSHPMLPHFLPHLSQNGFRANKIEVQARKDWRETAEQETSSLTGVVLKVELCTFYLDIYLKLTFSILRLIPFSFALSPPPSFSLSCLCVHLCVPAHTWILGISYLQFSWWANASQFQLVTCDSFKASRSLLLKFCLPRPSSRMAPRQAQLFLLCGSHLDHRKHSNPHSPDELWECKPMPVQHQPPSRFVTREAAYVPSNDKGHASELSGHTEATWVGLLESLSAWGVDKELPNLEGKRKKKKKPIHVEFY